MHPAWEVIDVVRLIVKHCDKHSLTQLACTSQYMSEMVAERTWKVIPSRDTSCLMTCLPADYIERTLEEQDIWRLKCAIANTRELYHTWSKYGASRSMYNREVTKSWKALWTEITKLRRPHEDIWPKLQKLVVTEHTPESLLPFLGMRGDALVYLYIVIWNLHRNPFEAETPETLSVLLHGLGDTTRLTSLTIHSHEYISIPWRVIRAPYIEQLSLEVTIRRRPLTPIAENHTLSVIFQQLAAQQLKSTQLDLNKVPRLLASIQAIAPERADCSSSRMIDLTSTQALCIALILCVAPETFRRKTDEASKDTAMFGQDPAIRAKLEAFTGHELIPFHRMIELVTSREVLIDAAEVASIIASKVDAVDEFRGHSNIWAASAQSFRNSLAMLSPMRHIRSLLFTELPDFLAYDDTALHRSITNNMQLLESFSVYTNKLPPKYNDVQVYISQRRTASLKQIARFCSHLPKLRCLKLDCVALPLPGPVKRSGFECRSVRRILAGHRLCTLPLFQGQKYDEMQATEEIRKYFPNTPAAHFEEGITFLWLDNEFPESRI